MVRTKSSPAADPRRIALLLGAVGATWNAGWLIAGLISTIKNPELGDHRIFFSVILAAHAASLGACFAHGRWPGVVLLLGAASGAIAGMSYFYVVWPGAALLLAASLFRLVPSPRR